MTQLALEYEPFVTLPLRRPRFATDHYESMIERLRGKQIDQLYAWKELRDDGWDVTALLAPDGSVVMLACR